MIDAEDRRRCPHGLRYGDCLEHRIPPRPGRPHRRTGSVELDCGCRFERGRDMDAFSPCPVHGDVPEAAAAVEAALAKVLADIDAGMAAWLLRSG